MLSRLVSAALLVVAAVSPSVAAASTVPGKISLSIEMSPASPRAGSEVRLTGGAGAPSYAWDLDDDGQFDDDYGLGVTTSLAAGTRTVRAQAVTAFGVLTDSRTFTVHDWNVGPGGTVAATPYSARVGAPVTIEAEGSDPDGLSVQTALDLDGDGTFETLGATGTTSFATPGGRVIRARFTDDTGATSVATTTLDVHTGNIAPTARLEEAFPGKKVAAVDPDGEIVRYEYDVDGDGTFETDSGRNTSATWRGGVVNVRVTDDSGATAIERASVSLAPRIARVAQVGVPVKLSIQSNVDVSGWDADADGEFDDGTGDQISFTYPSAGTYAVRVRTTSGRVFVETISVRDSADIAVPAAQWLKVPPARATAPASPTYAVSDPAGTEASFDLDGNGSFGDGLPWTFSGPATMALKATDSGGRTAVTTTPVPFVPGDLGADASLRTWYDAAPLQAAYQGVWLWGLDSDPDDGRCCATVAWDTDDDGEYDDVLGPFVEGSLPSSFGFRVTDSAGLSTTVRRTVGPPRVAAATPKPAAPAWLRLTSKRPHLATLLRRGLTVNVICEKPKCRTRLVATVDAKTAKKLKLRSRTVASRTVSGSHRVSLKLTAKARRALTRVRSVTLTLTATATADGAARTAQTTKLTIRP